MQPCRQRVILAGQSRPAVLDPPRTDRGDGWYDTGDVVTLDRDGFAQIQGRAKRFAKVGGEMISLAAIEELASRAWPEARHAALTISDSQHGILGAGTC